MKTFSVLIVSLTFLVGIIIVMPAPAQREPPSSFVRESICDLRTEYEERLAACDNEDCRVEWQTKLDILNEEER